LNIICFPLLGDDDEHQKKLENLKAEVLQKEKSLKKIVSDFCSMLQSRPVIFLVSLDGLRQVFSLFHAAR
jgi:hypothetical protein